PRPIHGLQAIAASTWMSQRIVAIISWTGISRYPSLLSKRSGWPDSTPAGPISGWESPSAFPSRCILNFDKLPELPGFRLTSQTPEHKFRRQGGPAATSPRIPPIWGLSPDQLGSARAGGQLAEVIQWRWRAV